MLAQELYGCFRMEGADVVCKGRPEVDVTKVETIKTVLHSEQPSLVINPSGFTAVDQAESESEQAFVINRDGVKSLAEQTYHLDIPLIHISTDYVFDGTGHRPYREDDSVSPLGVYGQSKWEGEEAVRQSHPQHIILRTSWLYSIYGKNFLKTIVARAKEGKALRVVNDQYGCPTWAKDVASALVAIVNATQEDKERLWGTYHFCGAGETTWYEFAQAIIEEAQCISPFQSERMMPITTDEYPTLAKRPRYSVLDCSKIAQAFEVKPPQWRDSLRQCVKELMACPNFLHMQS